jgi:branched-chain amino acid transport system substrate-binding protein
VRRIGRIVAIGAAFAVLAGACSKASSSKSSGSSTPSGGSTAYSATPAKKFTLDKPVKLVAIISSKGQDALAVADFNDGAKLAVDEINKAGGLGGHPIEFQSIATPPYGDITNSLNQAIDAKPTAILGPVSSTTLDTISSKVDAAGIPVLHDATAKEASLGGPNGSQWIFGLRPWNSSEAVVAADLATTQLNAKKVGVLYLNATFGKDGDAAAKAALTKAGATVGPETAFGATQTDFTKEVQAMTGTDAVIDWGTPASLASTVTTFAQQGLSSTPHIGPGSTGFASFYTGVSDPKLLDHTYGVLDCNPVGDSRAAVKDWVARFQKAYHYLPSYSSAELYDAVYMLRTVIEKADKADPATIRDGLASIDYTNGICASRYKSDKNTLFDEAVTVKFVDGKPQTTKHYTGINANG